MIRENIAIVIDLLRLENVDEILKFIDNIVLKEKLPFKASLHRDRWNRTGAVIEIHGSQYAEEDLYKVKNLLERSPNLINLLKKNYTKRFDWDLYPTLVSILVIPSGGP